MVEKLGHFHNFFDLLFDDVTLNDNNLVLLYSKTG